MSSSDVRILLVPASGVAAFQLVAVGVLRAHGFDDALPDLPEEQLPVFTLQRPASAFFAAAWTGDARDAFAGNTRHAGLVITAQRQQAGVLMLASPRASNRFPWHPGCERIASRCSSLSRAQLLEASARGKPSLQQATGGLAFPQQLVPVAVHDEPAFLQDLAAAVILQHNAHALEQLQQQLQQQQQQQPALIPLLLQTVQQTAAAVSIQAAWRAHSSRLRHQIADRALAGRATRAIQAAWRAFVLRSRLAMLSAAASAYRHAQTHLLSSNIMCLDVGSCRLLQAAAEAAQRGAALFPEHRLWFVLAPEQGDMFLVESSSGDGGGDSSSSNSVRSGLPAWLGADIPVIAACSAAEGALGRVHTRTLLDANCLVKDLLDPDDVAAGVCRLSDVAQLVTFSSKQQAAQRAALLAAYTFDVRSRQHARLLTVQESPLGAAYRSLTGFNSTAAKPAGAATAALCSGGSSAAVPALQRHYHAVAAAAAAPCDAAAALAPPPTATALTGQPPAARTSPRDCMFRRPLQPIHPTDTLLAATTAAAASSSSSSSGGAGVQGAASAGLQFHVSVLSRFPHLLRVLAAADVAHAAAGEQRPGVQQQQQLGVVLDPGAAELTVQPPAAVVCQPGVNSQGAYALLTKLAEVDGFKAQLADTAAAAAKEAAAERLLRQQAAAAAKAAAEAPGGTECALMSTSNCASPTYWPDTPTEAAGAAHAAREQAAAAAARRVSQLREQHLREQHQALQQQEQRQARSKAAGQLEHKVAQQQLQVQQQRQQVAATTQASALKQLREAAPAARLKQQQGVAAFASTCNQLSKRMRACIVAAARQADGQAKAAAAQQQRQQDTQAADALRCRQQEAHGEG